MPGLYRLEIQTIAGGGKLSVSGQLSREPVRVAFDYFKANASPGQWLDSPNRERLPPAFGPSYKTRATLLH